MVAPKAPLPAMDGPLTLQGACHCKAVHFTLHLADGFASARRCDCSFCRMRGAVVVSATAAHFTLHGAENLTLYQFNTKVAKHWFCKICGIYTHHVRRSDPSGIGVNIACLDGVSPFDLAEVKVMDGVNHPSDNDGRSRIAGLLRYHRGS